MKNKLLKNMLSISLSMLILLSSTLIGFNHVKAEAASGVTIGVIDYEELTIQIYNNNNLIVYYSMDSSSWTEVEGIYDSTLKCYLMDISWVSAKSDVTLYFKGNIATSIVYITIPMQDTTFSVIYDKAECDFSFVTSDDAEFIEWRKANDYCWYKVNLNDESASFKAFINTMETFRNKGAKLIFRIPQVSGTANNPGSRPSKEVSVTITARPDAPSISVNPFKLTINTTSSMEYYDSASSSWMDCSSSMSLDEIAPGVLYENGSHTVTLMIRKALTTSSPYSRTAYITIKGQAGAPQIGDNSKDVTYYYMNSQLVMSFNHASTASVYEYAIVTYDDIYDPATVKWITVNNPRLITLSSRTAPDSCTIYVRKKGTEANTSKNIEMVLSSAAGSFDVNY